MVVTASGYILLPPCLSDRVSELSSWTLSCRVEEIKHELGEKCKGEEALWLILCAVSSSMDQWITEFFDASVHPKGFFAFRSLPTLFFADLSRSRLFEQKIIIIIQMKKKKKCALLIGSKLDRSVHVSRWELFLVLFYSIFFFFSSTRSGSNGKNRD